MRYLLALALLAVSAPLEASLIASSGGFSGNTNATLGLTVTTSGGTLGNLGSFLTIGGQPGLGVYFFQFSQPIDYLILDFVALYDFSASLPKHAILDFQADGAPITISYANIFNTTIDGGIISTILPSRDSSGQISYGSPGAPTTFQTFSFTATQGVHPEFWISSITINTVETTDTPEPTTAALIATALAALLYRRHSANPLR